MGGSRSRSRSPVYRRERRKSRSRSRDRDRERDKDRRRDRHRSRSRTPPRKRRSSRSRSPRRRRSRSLSRDRSRLTDESSRDGKISKSQLLDRPQITDADLEGKTEDEIAMMKLMGFATFDTTKGKHVKGNNQSAVNTIHKRKYRIPTLDHTVTIEELISNINVIDRQMII